MGITQLIVLAVVQGLTEFLPISSSGHLILVPSLFGWSDQGLAFDVAVHFGSLIAVCIFFRVDIYALLRGMQDVLVGKFSSADARMFWNLGLEREDLQKYLLRPRCVRAQKVKGKKIKRAISNVSGRSKPSAARMTTRSCYRAQEQCLRCGTLAD